MQFGSLSLIALSIVGQTNGLVNNIGQHHNIFKSSPITHINTRSIKESKPVGSLPKWSKSVHQRMVTEQVTGGDDDDDDDDNNYSDDHAMSSSSPPSVATQIFNTIGSTTSAVVASTIYVVLACRRDAFMVSFFIGAISNGILSKLLKKLLKQERPAELDVSGLEVPPSDNGMPSSHAMSLGFICTFTALQLPWTALPLLGYVITSLVYRVRTKLHTVEQILVGVLLGSTNGYIWRSLVLGTNPFGVDVSDWVSSTFLNQEGLLPYYGLLVPAVVGAMVVGSVERRISILLANSSKED